MGIDNAVRRIGRDQVDEAQARLQHRVRRTPVMLVARDQLGQTHPPFWIKLESLQFTGAFKARGALNSALSADLTSAGICAASGGNHGQAVAWSAKQLGITASVFVPSTCPEIKLRRLAAYGARTSIVGDIYEESLVAAQDFAAQSGAFLIHSYDEADTVAGSATVFAEFVDQVGMLDTVMVAVGGGGLLAGAVAATEGRQTRFVAVEPATCRCLGAALEAGEPVDVQVGGVAVDSLGVRRIGNYGLEAARRSGARHVEVTDDQIRATQKLAWDELRIGLEGGGATALAALISGAYEPDEDEVVGIVACGGNVDIARLLSAA